MKKFIALIITICLISTFVLGCQQNKCTELEETVADLIDTVNELLVEQEEEEPEAEPEADAIYYYDTNISINIIINVVEGINAGLVAFEDMDCTIELGESKIIGNIAQGIIAHEMYHFWLKNTGEVDLSVHLSTGSTPFGNAWLGPATLEPIQTIDLLAGEVEEMVIVVSVNPDTELGTHSFPIYMVGEELQS